MLNKKCKSLVLPNQVFMKKGKEMVGFPVFRDKEVGIDSVNGKAIMEINADEDVESTKSIVDYGTKLCYLDLKDFLDQNQSYGEYWFYAWYFRYKGNVFNRFWV